MNLDHERQAEIMSAFEKGQRLYSLLHSPGYQDLLDILEAEVTKYEFRALNLKAGVSHNLLRDTIGHARTARSIFEQLQLRINASIEIGMDAARLPEQIAEQAAYSNL